ncbi:hypothetical protein ACFQ10_43645 [Streptomyces indonesiensis]
MCTFADGDEHERLRAALTESMGRFDRRGIRRHVTRFTHQLVNDFCADGGAEMVTAFAQQLPMLVLTQLLGMPDEYGPRLVEATRDLMKGTETALRSDAYVTEALKGLVDRRRAEPGEDLASWLLAHPSGLTEEEVVQHLRLVLLTGNETTTNLMANTLRMVLTDPRFRASLAGGHDAAGRHRARAVERAPAHGRARPLGHRRHRAGRSADQGRRHAAAGAGRRERRPGHPPRHRRAHVRQPVPSRLQRRPP